MYAISPWAVAACDCLNNADLKFINTKTIADYTFNIYNSGDSLWVIVQQTSNCRISFRTAFTPNSFLEVTEIKERKDGLTLKLKAVIGTYKVKINFPDPAKPIFRYTTSFKSSESLMIPFWPRDIIINGIGEQAPTPEGEIYASQKGLRSGSIYGSINRPKAGSFLYWQNLSAIGDYCQQTETSLTDTVGGQWPELGFAIPITKEKPVKAGVEYIINDAFVAFDPSIPADEFAMAVQYMDLLAQIYLHLPRPDTKTHNWPEILKNGLNDLEHNAGCWSQVKGHAYLTPYLSDYKSPPEIMVQLAVLLPIIEYTDWSGEDHASALNIINGLPDFYDDKIKTIVRWLPAAIDRLDGSEEQKQPRVMDSWYLHHPLLNLSRMALQGNKIARKLFLDSIGYCIKVGHHFKYQWPVFYNLDTLEIVKAETQPGKGGEKDVPGLFAHVMMQAWELTGDKKYLNEAEKAARKLKGFGFELFYQANNTSFGAGALVRLYKATKNELYLNLSYVCIANMFRNMRIWNCNYGYGKMYPTFLSVFPLNDAPYTAVYEEQEVFSAFHEYLLQAEGLDIPASISMMLAEYIRFMNYRAPYYYPPMLPDEMLSDEVKTGEMDKKLWIAVEDLQDGWTKSGSVGQEVYGAGVAFGIVPRHFLKVPGESFMIYIDYPTTDFNCKKGNPITFRIKGSELLTCRMLVINTDGKKLPKFKVIGNKQPIEGKLNKDHNLEFTVTGNQKIQISW
jgi:hypothetical protein